MQKQSFFWIVPFICFLLGYYALFRLITVDYVETPSLIGLSLSDALKTMSLDRLQGQIVAEKEDADLEPGVVVDQRPHAGQKVKRSQPISLTVAKRPSPLVAPLCISLDKAGIEELVAPDRIRVKYHELESALPSGLCYAQYPAPGQELTDRLVHVYMSRGSSSVRLFPDCKNRSIHEVVPFLQSHGMASQIFHTMPVAADHDCSYCVVQSQKPLAGTLVDLKKPLTVQLMVAPTL